MRLVVSIMMLVGVLFFALPIMGLIVRTPWHELGTTLTSPSVQSALRLSLWASGSAWVVSVIMGLPLALWLAAGSGGLRTIVRAIVMLPIVLPPIVAGIALLMAFGRGGLAGDFLLKHFGLALPFTTLATVVAAAYMGMPFFVLSVEAGLRSLDQRWLDMARTLGAKPARCFFSVTLPMILPSLVTGSLLCFARALGEYCATQLFAGNFEGTTRTMPLACGLAMEVDPSLAVVLSMILATVSLTVLLLLRRSLRGVER